MILPPFPTPSKWKEVGAIQLFYNENYWSTGTTTSVPSGTTVDDAYADHHIANGGDDRVDDTVTAVTCSEEVPSTLDSIVPINADEMITGGDDAVLEEVLTLNDFWATRLSKTMSKMKKKRHIARRRTMRKDRKAVKSPHGL